MAPGAKEDSTAGGDDKMKMLKTAIKCFNGTCDFEKLAEQMGVANGEAM